jgi:hypothetical protein
MLAGTRSTPYVPVDRASALTYSCPFLCIGRADIDLL